MRRILRSSLIVIGLLSIGSIAKGSSIEVLVCDNQTTTSTTDMNVDVNGAIITETNSQMTDCYAVNVQGLVWPKRGSHETPGEVPKPTTTGGGGSGGGSGSGGSGGSGSPPSPTPTPDPAPTPTPTPPSPPSPPGGGGGPSDPTDPCGESLVGSDVSTYRTCTPGSGGGVPPKTPKESVPRDARKPSKLPQSSQKQDKPPLSNPFNTSGKMPPPGPLRGLHTSQYFNEFKNSLGKLSTWTKADRTKAEGLIKRNLMPIFEDMLRAQLFGDQEIGELYDRLDDPKDPLSVAIDGFVDDLRYQLEYLPDSNTPLTVLGNNGVKNIGTLDPPFDDPDDPSNPFTSVEEMLRSWLDDNGLCGKGIGDVVATVLCGDGLSAGTRGETKTRLSKNLVVEYIPNIGVRVSIGVFHQEWKDGKRQSGKLLTESGNTGLTSGSKRNRTIVEIPF